MVVSLRKKGKNRNSNIEYQKVFEKSKIEWLRVLISWCIPVLNLLGTPTQPSANQSILSSWLLPARRWQVSMEIYSQPGKGNSQMMALWKGTSRIKCVLENSGKSTMWSKFGVAWLSEKLLHAELRLLIYFSGEGCPSSGLATTLLASTFCFPDPSPPKGLSTNDPTRQTV